MGNPAHFYFIPDYYDYPSVRKFVQANGISETMEFEASQGSDGIHEEYGIDALMMLADPKTVRINERVTANRATTNGASLLPVDKTLAFGKRIVGLRTQLTVEAIRKAMAGAEAGQSRWNRAWRIRSRRSSPIPEATRVAPPRPPRPAVAGPGT